MEEDRSSGEKQNKQDQLKPYLKYSGMAMQMIVTLVIAAFGGMKLDEYAGNKNPWFTIILMVIGVVASIYSVIKSVSKNQ